MKKLCLAGLPTLLILGCLASNPTLAEPRVYDTTVRIESDVTAARNVAIGRIMTEIAMDGEVRLRSSTAVINAEATQATLLTSTARLTRLKIKEEKIENGRFFLSLTADQSTMQTPSCATGWRARHTALRVEHLGAEDPVRSALLLTTAQQLREKISTLITDDQNPDQAGYSLQLQSDPGNATSLRVQIRGSSGILISELHYDFLASDVFVTQREPFAGATLKRQVLSPKALTLMRKIAIDAEEILRCLPLILRLADGLPANGRLAIPLELADERPAIALLAHRFPLRPDNHLDLLALENILTVIDSDESGLTLENIGEREGRPARTPARFLLVQ